MISHKVAMKVFGVFGAVLVWSAMFSLLFAQILQGPILSATPASTVDESHASDNALESSFEARIRRSQAVHDLIALTADLANRVAAADPERLRVALEGHDSAALIRLLGFSVAESEEVSSRLNAIRVRLFIEFPELQTIIEEHLPSVCADPSVCSPERVLEVSGEFGSAMAMVVESLDGEEATSDDDAGCHWGQYLAALSLCTLAGPYLYWVCSYLAYCTYCWGSLRDKLCV